MILQRLRRALRLPRPVQRSVDRFLAALDSEGVVLFQAIVYVAWSLHGAYLLGAADGDVPAVVERSLGRELNALWIWMCIGTSVCLVGKVLAPDKNRYWVHLSGLLLQLGGDMWACGSFFIYVSATVIDTYWGKAVTAVFIFSALWLCTVLLVVRDVRRIQQDEQKVRE